jgi:antitoxin YefM
MGSVELTYSELRANLAKVWDQVIANCEAAIVHRRGAEDVAILPASELRGLLETAHLLRSPRNAQRLLSALQSAVDGAGESTPLGSLAAEFGLEIGATEGVTKSVTRRRDEEA